MTQNQPKAVLAPEEVAAVNRAYAGAIDMLSERGVDDRARPVLAKHVMDLAISGLRDETRLRDVAIERTMRTLPDAGRTRSRPRLATRH